MISLRDVAKKMHSGTKLAESSKAEVKESTRKLSYIKEINNKKKNMEKSEKVNILYIVVSDDLKCKIYINDRQSPWVELSPDYKQLIERFKKELTEFTGSEESIERFGAEFYKVLPYDVRKELEDKKIDWVWIDCTQEEINPFWEWIYTGDGEPFFWGDKFSIVRIQEGCDMSDCRVHNEVNILADGSTGDLSNYAKDLKNELNKAGVSECRVIPPSDSDTELDISSDCIIYATGVDANKMYKDKLEDFFLDRKKILFWNLYPSRPLRLEELPATWLDTRFEDLDIPKEFTLCFVKLFFDVLKELLEEVNGANEEREVTVAEVLRKTRERLISNQKGSQFNNLWRLAYTVNGNPCTKLTVRH